MNVINRTLQIEIAIDTNGTPEVEIDHLLHLIPNYAANNGMFTGDTPAEVLGWSAELIHLPDGEDDNTAEIYVVNGYAFDCPSCGETNDIEQPHVDSVSCAECGKNFPAIY